MTATVCFAVIPIRALAGLCTFCGVAPDAANRPMPAGRAVRPPAVSAVDSLPTAAVGQDHGPVSVTLEACGRIRIESRPVTLRQLCDTLRDRAAGHGRGADLELQAGPGVSQSYLDALMRRIAETGVGRDRIRVRREAPPPGVRHDSKVVDHLLAHLWPDARRAVGRVASDKSRIAHEVEWRGAPLRSRLEAIQRVVAQ